MERKTRIPTQKRSLEKYEKIIDAAFKLFNEKGYYNVTTIDIAKEANVATGSLYSYFNDKKDIYIEILKRIANNIVQPTVEFWKQNNNLNFQDVASVKKLFEIFIKIMMEHHNFSKLFHDDMTALTLLDKDISDIREENDRQRIERTREILNMLSIPFKNDEAFEIFLHYCNLLIDDVCHQILYDKTIKDIDLYIEQAVDILYLLLQNLADI
ncbi:TetR/AcrR family transcriptional regulator [Anaeromicropila herbilytica]|uniref:AcrR family transcriptional regulator n=1 Tax=Anaeromicropila herbilytica TaxID=2785025 RepID=A0A7R7EMY6_9FIRM|nr:TetR/AcrR family transcriptional regulator [Anaeromicropila herbilytica]BCN31826.1 AcrR family transcriptional regulator [Anaeromicropila herbilytica]